MDVKLHHIKGNPKGKVVNVPEGTLKVGRAEDSDLIIASTRVSRHHCEITHTGTTLTLQDRGSGNGSLVNGTRVQQQVLKAGDELQIGPLTFVVTIDGVGERAARPAPAAGKPVAAPKPAAKPAAKGKPGDVLSSLERMATPKKPARPSAADDVVELSDDDLIDS